MEAVSEYQAASGQKVFVEYVVLAGVNDSLEEAKELGELLQVPLQFAPYDVFLTPNPSLNPNSHHRQTQTQQLMSDLKAHYDVLMLCAFS
eukprot:scaffold104622_cov22-Prasinocladus_malaysianus.AAC.1